MECGSAAAALESRGNAGSWRYRTPRCRRHKHFQSDRSWQSADGHPETM